MNSACNQKLNKLDISDSSDSSYCQEELDIELIHSMINQIFGCLVQAKVLSKDSPQPDDTMMNLNYLVNTLCDEFLLEIDLPTARTHCSTEETSKPSEVSMSEDEEPADVLTKLFTTSKPLVLSAKSCALLKELIVNLSRGAMSKEILKKVKQTDEKIALYGETILNYSKKLKEKDREIEILKKQLKEAKNG